MVTTTPINSQNTQAAAKSKLSGKLFRYLSKGAGIAALGVIAYDAHTWGKIQADVYAKSRDADACTKAFNNTQYLTEPSVTTAALKKGWYHLETDSNVRHFVNSAIGYFKGISSMLVNSVIPLSLGLGALIGKGKVSKGCALGLGVYGVLKLFKDVLGFGHYNDLNKKF